jgi:hypothetical protein
LEYDRTPNHVTRGQFRIFLILLFVNTIAIVGYLWAPNSLSGRAGVARLSSPSGREGRDAEAGRPRGGSASPTCNKTIAKVARDQLPKDTVIYTEDGVEARVVDRVGPGVRDDRASTAITALRWTCGNPPSAGRGRRPRRAATDSSPGRSTISPRQILGASCMRKNPAGQERLLWCDLGRQAVGESSNYNSSRSSASACCACG